MSVILNLLTAVVVVLDSVSLEVCTVKQFTPTNVRSYWLGECGNIKRFCTLTLNYYGEWWFNLLGTTSLVLQSFLVAINAILFIVTAFSSACVCRAFREHLEIRVNCKLIKDSLRNWGIQIFNEFFFIQPPPLVVYYNEDPTKVVQLEPIEIAVQDISLWI